ncbi:hypothetical protein ACFLTK_05055, partial [Chloroflexota bacterium]
YRREISDVETPQGRRDLSKSRLTIRKAKWMAQLYPIVEPLVTKQYPDDRDKHIGYWSRIADVYAEHEQIAGISGQPLDTHLLDTLLFVREDLTIDDALLLTMWGEMTPEERKTYVKLLSKMSEINNGGKKNERQHNQEK